MSIALMLSHHLIGLADMMVASALVRKILDQYRIPYYTMGVVPGVAGRPQAGGAVLPNEGLIVALIDRVEDIPKELHPYILAHRTSEVMVGGKPALDPNLAAKLRTDQLEHDIAARIPTPLQPVAGLIPVPVQPPSGIVTPETPVAVTPIKPPDDGSGSGGDDTGGGGTPG